jgi:hypothetical protein
MSMILLAGLIALPPVAAVVIGAIIVAGQQLLAPIEAKNLGALAIRRSGNRFRAPPRRVSKYPPSLLFVLITLGVSMLCMLARQRLRGVLARAARVRPNTALYICATYICGARVRAAGRGARRLSGVVSGELPRGSVPAREGRLGLQPAGCLPGVVHDPGRAVPVRVLVRGREAAAA